MNRPSTLRAFAAYASALVAFVSTTLPLSAAANEEVAVAGPAAPRAMLEPEIALATRMQVGDATRNLLTIQHEGASASPTPRPIAGDVASLSYQRYIDSFKFPIPEKFNTTVHKSGNGGSK